MIGALAQALGLLAVLALAGYGALVALERIALRRGWIAGVCDCADPIPTVGFDPCDDRTWQVSPCVRCGHEWVPSLSPWPKDDHA